MDASRPHPPAPAAPAQLSISAQSVPKVSWVAPFLSALIVDLSCRPRQKHSQRFSRPNASETALPANVIQAVANSVAAVREGRFLLELGGENAPILQFPGIVGTSGSLVPDMHQETFMRYWACFFLACAAPSAALSQPPRTSCNCKNVLLVANGAGDEVRHFRKHGRGCCRPAPVGAALNWGTGDLHVDIRDQEAHRRVGQCLASEVAARRSCNPTARFT